MHSVNFLSCFPGAGEATAGEVGGGEQLCLLPAREELSQLKYCANSSSVQAAPMCYTQASSAVISGIHSALNGAGGS